MDLDDYVPVAMAARHLGLSDRRVRQLIESGALPARRMGHALLVPASAVASMKVHQSRRRRPLSPRSAATLLGALDELLGAPSPFLDAATDRDRSRARARARQLVDDPEAMALLRAWIPPGGRRLALVHLGSPEAVADDPGVAVTGISHPLSGMAPAGEFEGHVAPTEVDDVVARHRLVPPPTGQPANVVLHVDEAPVTPARVLLALADWASPREDEQALRMLRGAAGSDS